MHRSRAALALLVVGVLAGCDSSPSDPLDPRTDLAPLLQQGGAPAVVPGLALPGLLQAAVHRVYSEDGAGAARALVSELRTLQGTANSSAAGAEAAAARHAARQEELRIVLRVFGPRMVLRVIETVAMEGERLRARLDGASNGWASNGWASNGWASNDGASTGADAAARPLLAELAAHVERAQAAADAGAWLDALDQATQAAASADAVRRVLQPVRAVAGLDELFQVAAAGLAPLGEGRAPALARYDRLAQEGRAAAGSGDRERAHTALKAVRDEQIRIVLQVLGEAAVRRLLAETGSATAELGLDLERARAAGRDVLRIERMTASALDMLNRARASLDAGDASAALDLGSHAAGLASTARAALTY